MLDPRNTGTITLPIEFVAGNAPLVLGVSVSPQTGKPYSISTLALFFSEVALVSADGAEVPVQLTNVTHAPLPYNVLFVNADAEPRPSLALAAPPGAYAGLVLGVGLPVHCNQGDPSKRVAPLNYDTGMFWTWGTQYVFFKAEGKYTDTATGFAYHMGFDMNYRRVKLTGSVAVTAADSVGPTLRVDLDPVVGGAPDDAAAVAHLSGQAWLANILESKPALALQR